MSDISIRSRTLYNEDQRWIGSGGIAALADADAITLDRSVFVAATHYPNNFIPSGMCLGKITATGLYAQYDDAAVDGREVAVGFLATSVVVDPNAAATADIVAALYWHGEVVEAFLPTNHGLNAAGKVDLAAKFRFV
jgi:hypothetical protein